MNEAGRDRVAALLRRPAVARLLEVLNGSGEETRIVGGAVRNALMQRDVADVDLATTATPDVVVARCGAAGLKVVPTGLDHGTVTVVVHGTPFEVTTLREDVATDGRHAIVRFGHDFARDAQRRDFTMNALSVDAAGCVHDYVGGLGDLDAKKVRFIGDATTRIREDFLRILRFFRFSAEYADGPFDGEGFAAAIRERDGLRLLSRERIRSEFLKLLAAPRAPEVVQDLSDAGLLGILLGGVGETGRLARVSGFEGEAGAADPIRRLAGLAVMTSEDADRLRENLRLSNAEHERLLAYARALAGLRSSEPPLDGAAVRRIVVLHGAQALGDALAAVRGEPRPVLSDEGRLAAERFSTGAEPAPVFPLRGADLMARGIPPGQEIGWRLAAARRQWLDEGCPEGDGTSEGLIAFALAAGPGER